MDFSSKSPKKEFTKDIASKIEIPKYCDKELRNNIDKPNLKPNNKPKNKIEPRQIDPKKEPKHKIQPRKIDTNSPPRNKIEYPRFSINKEPKNKIQHQKLKVSPNTKPKNDIKEPISPPRDKTKIKISRKEIKHNNLLDPKIQNLLKRYHNEIGKYPNYGRNLKKDFIKWAIENNPEVSEKIKEIHNNQEISKFIKYEIQNFNLSQSEIANKFYSTGLSVSRKTIGNYALKEVFKGNQVEYKKRFDNSLKPEIKGRIINRLNVEVENYTAGVRHDSLYKIAKLFPEVSKSTIDKIAKNEISQDVYKKMWPCSSGTVDHETKQNIRNFIEREVQEGNIRSLRNISEDFPDVSKATISDLAKKMYPEKYKELWPAFEKIPEETKVKIINTIQNEAEKINPRTLRGIHKDFQEVGADTIKRFAHKAVSKDIHCKIWSNEIPEIMKEKIRGIIRNEINLPNPRSLHSIRKEFGVGYGSVLLIAKEEVPKEIYERTWPAPKEISLETKNNIANDIRYSKLNINEIAETYRVSTTSVSNISQNEVFRDSIKEHRERFPYDENFELGNYTHLNMNSVITKSLNENDEKYYSEPRIYPHGKRSDGLILEIDGFIQKRLSNSINGEYLIEKLELKAHNLDQIKFTQFDFTNDIGIENLLNKIEKYQSEDSLLIIVGTRWHLFDEIKHLPKDERIKYPQNVRVISYELAADFLGLINREKIYYDKIIDYNNDFNLNSLQGIYHNVLSKFVSYNTNDLREDMIQRDLIKENFNEYFQFEAIKNKDKNERQIDLDYFINR